MGLIDMGGWVPGWGWGGCCMREMEVEGGGQGCTDPPVIGTKEPL